MSAEQIDLSIVVPCYRSGDWLGELAEQVSAALEPSGLRFELVLVNDASGDETWNVIRRLPVDSTLSGVSICFSIRVSTGRQCVECSMLAVNWS